MKRQITPTQVERVMRENDFIVSKTDLTGRITYGNKIFIEFSGYDEEELLGTQHNIIRHPDMPRAVFKLLWDTLKQEQEVCAYVKNMAKDGSHYWVFANVTPSYDLAGKVIGYYSVRRKPREDVVKVIAQLYKKMREIERNNDPNRGLELSTKLLTDLLTEHKTTYEKFILTL